MNKRLKKLLGLGILAAVAIAAVPAVDVAAVGEANGTSNEYRSRQRELPIDRRRYHEWKVFFIDYGTLGAFCTQRPSIEQCRYQGAKNAVEITVSASDETYSGKPYSGLRMEWEVDDKPPINNIYYKGTDRTNYKSSNPPSEVDNYAVVWATPMIGYYIADFRILPPENSIQNGNTQGNTGNDSRSSNIPESNMPTKPAFDSKVCMDKVRDMARAELADENLEGVAGGFDEKVDIYPKEPVVDRHRLFPTKSPIYR